MTENTHQDSSSLWIKKYISIPFKPFNCASFVETILKNEFGCDKVFPQTVLNVRKDIENIKNFLFCLERTNTPVTGDIVLMDGFRESCHVGVFVNLKNVHYVLHSDIMMKSGVIQRVSDLHLSKYFLNGYYKWK